MRVPRLLTSEVVLAVLGGALCAQTQIDLRTQSKSADFSAASSTKPAKAGTALPSSCTAGEMFYKTDAPAGANLYGCTTQNTWTLLSGGSGGAAAPNYSVSFSAQTTVSIPGSAHGFATANLIVDCYDSAVPANRIEADRVSVHTSTYDVTVAFATAQSGKCVVNGSGGGAGTGGAVSSVFGRTGVVTAQSGDYSFPQISGTVTNAQIAAGVDALKLAAGTVGNTELGYLGGVTSPIQTQLAGKAAVTHTHTLAGDVTGSTGTTTVTALRNRLISSATPQHAQALIWNATLSQWEPGTAAGSGAGSGSQLTDFQVTRTSSTVLTVGASCSAGNPCNVRFGNKAYSFTASATVTLSAGTGTAYIYATPAGALTVGHNLTLSCAGCYTDGTATSFPSDSIPLFTWTAANGVWDAAGGADRRAFLSTKTITAGTGVAVADSGGGAVVSIDSAVVGLRVAIPATSTSACIPGSWAADDVYLYVCPAADTWRRAALTSW